MLAHQRTLFISACQVLGAAASGTVWASNGDWALTNSNLTAQRTGTSTFWGMEHATATKTNGTVIFTYNAAGSAANNYIGFDTGSEANQLGNSGTGQSIGWRSDGAIIFAGAAAVWVAGGTATTAAWITTHAYKITKAGSVFTFYIDGVSQGQVDTSSATYGLGSVMAGNCYPSLCSQNATGFQVTADFSGF